VVQKAAVFIHNRPEQKNALYQQGKNIKGLSGSLYFLTALTISSTTETPYSLAFSCISSLWSQTLIKLFIKNPERDFASLFQDFYVTSILQHYFLYSKTEQKKLLKLVNQ
jgi:hypothetical protein